MLIRNYKSEDYSTLCKWFDAIQWSHWDESLISPYSYIISYSGKDVAFSSYFRLEGTSGAILGFTIADSTFKESVRNECLDALLNHVFREARESGVKYMHYYTDSKSMVKRLSDKHGMTITDNGDAYILLKVFKGNGNFLNE